MSDFPTENHVRACDPRVADTDIQNAVNDTIKMMLSFFLIC
jgi:hypothetical protein